MISFVIFSFSIIFIFFLSRNLSRPIVRLADEAIKIKNFDLDSWVDIHSNIYEINRLNSSMYAMRKSLQAFALFVPKSIVRKLTQKGHDIKIGGRAKLITLLFTDIANFTSISETYPPEKLMPHLSEYFNELTSIISDAQGTIDKYIGDAIMAFWGAPNADRFHAINACNAALRCQKTLLGLNRKWRADGKSEFRTRIGVHSGEAIVGNVGSSDRVNYTALGDSVNLAARLEGVNKMYSTNIIISEAVHALVHKECIVRPLDVVAVKGKEKGVVIYELVGLKKGDPSLFPSRKQAEFCDLFTQGFKVYLERRWDEAIGIFEKIHDKFGSEDPTIKMYIDRCLEFKKNPPHKKWDGVIHLKTK